MGPHAEMFTDLLLRPVDYQQQSRLAHEVCTFYLASLAGQGKFIMVRILFLLANGKDGRYYVARPSLA